MPQKNRSLGARKNRSGTPRGEPYRKPVLSNRFGMKPFCVSVTEGQARTSVKVIFDIFWVLALTDHSASRIFNPSTDLGDRLRLLGKAEGWTITHLRETRSSV